MTGLELSPIGDFTFWQSALLVGEISLGLVVLWLLFGVLLMSRQPDGIDSQDDWP